MVDRSSTRSAGYQHVIVELPCDPETLAERSDIQGITGMVNSNTYSEELMELQDRLLTEFWRIVDTQLTKRQREVLHLYAQGLTQIEIAEKLNVNQSSITKSINGNCDYRNGRHVYGGAKRRILKIAAKDPVIQEIFRRIKEIKQDQQW